MVAGRFHFLTGLAPAPQLCRLMALKQKMADESSLDEQRIPIHLFPDLALIQPGRTKRSPDLAFLGCCMSRTWVYH